MRIECTDRNHSLASIRFSQTGVVQPSIAGQLRGPFCLHSRTLPSTTLINQGMATVVDPCYWTTKLPFLYEAKLEFETEHGIQRAEFQFGLRWCVADGPGLRLNAKWFVLRSVSGGLEPDLDEFRAASASLWMTQYCEATCSQASQRGVMVLCADLLSESQAASVDRFPAVFFAATRYNLSRDVIRLVGDGPRKGCVFVAEESALDAAASSSHSPCFVLRKSDAGAVSHLRRGCDALQRDVARIGQFAGYVVNAE